MFWLGLAIGFIVGLVVGILLILYGAEIFLLPYRLQRWRRTRKGFISEIERWLEKKLRI